MKGTHLAIIGGGAKAVAIAARAKVLSDLRIGNPVSITIFEKDEIGAHWKGDYGYTDGEQRLCTPIERDLGFPYQTLPPSIGERMHEQFSWPTFLIEKARNSDGEESFSRWVDQGRKPPSHFEFHQYLQWAAKKSKSKVINREVTRLFPDGGKWKIFSKDCKSGRVRAHSQTFDGVVVTGPGPAKVVKRIGSGDRIFDGRNFWTSRPRVLNILANLNEYDQIVIIGAGGTAAAIVAWLIRHGQSNRQIFIVAEQPAFFTRGDSVFENRLFNDELSWSALSRTAKNDFVNRLSRGVVWETVMSQVSLANNVNFIYGRARFAKSVPGGYELQVKTGSGDLVSVDASLVFDAAGFDAWWWTDLIDDDYFRDTDRDSIRQDLSAMVDDQLSFTSPMWPWPKLHAPMVATAIGPGYASLLTLGKVGERVLSAHLT